MLIVDKEYSHGILFIKLYGQLIDKSISKYDSSVIKEIKNAGLRYVVLNVSGLNDIDRDGIDKLIDTSKLCHKNDGVVLMCGINHHININDSHIFDYIMEIPNEKAADKLIDMRVR